MSSEDYDYNEGTICDVCDGDGEIMVCIDDLCNGQGFCIHKDGMQMCPACKGTGES